MKLKSKKRTKPKRTFSWMNPKLEVRLAPRYGKGAKGVFAKRGIEKDELLAIFGGYVIPLKEARLKYTSFERICKLTPSYPPFGKGRKVGLKT